VHQPIEIAYHYQLPQTKTLDLVSFSGDKHADALTSLLSLLITQKLNFARLMQVCWSWSAHVSFCWHCLGCHAALL